MWSNPQFPAEMENFIFCVVSCSLAGKVTYRPHLLCQDNSEYDILTSDRTLRISRCYKF